MRRDTPTRVTRSDHGPPSPPPSGDQPPEHTAARLFDLLWQNLADVLGAAATATLVRRGAKRAVRRGAWREGVTVTRDGFTYRYVLPASWSERSHEPLLALRDLVQELLPMLAELTGPVVVRRLEGVAEFRRCGLFSPEADR